MPKNATYFENEDEEPRNKHHSPSPNEWFGTDSSKFRSSSKSPTFSTEMREYDRSADWRDWFKGHKREPLWNPLLPAEKKQEAVKFRDQKNDPRGLIFVLENAAEAFEEAGHIDLAAECEKICEIICSEEKS